MTARESEIFDRYFPGASRVTVLIKPERFQPTRPAHFVLWLGALAAYLLALPFWMPAVIHESLMFDSILARGAVSVALIAPAGLLMGLGFPTGLRLVGRIDARLTPWLWGVNGAAGVLAAGLAVACSIGFSIDVTIRLGGLCYIVLLAAAWPLARRVPQP